MWNNVMVDLETMSTQGNAAIVAIGAVAFRDDGIGPEFYRTVDLKSSVYYGLHLDPDTIMWWMGQSNEARSALINGVRDLPGVLFDFKRWLGMECQFESGQLKVWGNGASFDNPILEHAFKVTGIGKPWNRKGDMCYRTLRKLYPEIKSIDEGVKHHALDDARFQAKHAVKILNHIKEQK